MLQVLNGPVIEAGESLSQSLDCRGGQLVRITMPVDWTLAPLTFQLSTDDVFYNDLYHLDGFEVTIPMVVPGSAVLVPNDVGRAIAFVRFRSGSGSNPVPQEEQRQFAVAIITDDEAPPA